MSDERLNKYGAWLLANEGKKGTPEFNQVAEAFRMLRSQRDFVAPAPPPGAIIHGGDGLSRVAGSDVTVKRDRSAITTPEQERQSAASMEALKQRGEGRNLGALRPALPLTVGMGQGWGDEALVEAMNAGSPDADTRAVNSEVVRQELEQERRENPIRSAITEGVGSVSTAIPLAMSGGTAARFLPQTASGAKGLGMRMMAGAADGAVLGGIYGAGSGNGDTRPTDAAWSAVTGALTGGFAPVVMSGLRAGADFLGLTTRAARARDRLALTLQRAGMSPDDVRTRLAGAAADGQPEYMAGDALERAGREELSRLSRTTSATGDKIYKDLETRQLGAQRRIGANIDEAATGRVGYTSKMAQDDILAARKTLADQQYAAARAQATPVDPTSAIAVADNFLAPGQAGNVVQSPLPDDSVESIVRRFRARMTDGNNILSDFNAAQRLKIDMDSAIDGARGDAARVLKQMRNQLDDALANSSQPYAAARDNFRKASKAAEAVDTGREIASRGRYEDTLQAFGSMAPEEQAAARVGFGSNLVEKTRAPKPTGDVTAYLRGADTEKEIAAILTDRLNRQVGREADMFQTFQRTAGGSQTAQNVAEDAAGMTGMFRDAAAGNVPGLLMRAAEKGTAALRGEREPVRQLIAQALMSNNADDLTRALAARSSNQKSLDAVTRALLLAGAVSPLTNRPQ